MSARRAVTLKVRGSSPHLGKVHVTSESDKMSSYLEWEVNTGSSALEFHLIGTLCSKAHKSLFKIKY